MLLILLGLISRADSTPCYGDDIAAPILTKEGDFLLAGIFDMSKSVRTPVLIDGSNTTTMICEEDSIHSLERALAFAWTLDNLTNLVGGRTLGYKIYQACDSKSLTRHVATEITRDDKVVGAIVPGNKAFVEPAIAMLSSTHIPAVSYIYSTEALLDQADYPNYLSLIETEQLEGESTMKLLEAFGYTFIDIWYHAYSQEMAEYIYENYVKKVGCGRLTEYYSKGPYNESGGITEEYLENILDTVYYNGSEREASVHLLLFNNEGSGKMFLEIVTRRGWRDKVYIFGYTNGRHKYVQSYTDIINTNLKGIESDDLLIFPQSDALNTPIDTIDRMFYQNKSLDAGALFDKFLNLRSKGKCNPVKDSTCTIKTSSWTPFLVLGAKILAKAVNSTLSELPSGKVPCIQTLRSQVYNSITQSKMNIDVGSMVFENITFDRSTLSSGYTVEVFRRSYSEVDVQILGKVSFAKSSLNVTTINTMRPTQRQQHCSVDCLPGTHITYRSYEDFKAFPCCWQCKPCKENSYTNQTNMETCEDCSLKEKASNDSTHCLPVGQDFIEYKSTKFITGAAIAILGTILTLAILFYIMKEEDRPIIKASDPVFCYIFLFSLLLGSITSMICIIVPSDTNCYIEYIACTLFASLVTSSLFLRCAKIYTLFAAAASFSKPKFGALFTPTGQITANCTLVVINVSIAITMLHFHAWKFEEDQVDSHKDIFRTCTSGNIKVAVAPFIISVLLFMTTLILAFKMRKFPHNFRETSNIFTATLVVFFACVMFLTGYKFSPYDIKALLRSIVVFLASISFLICMFIPKVIVLLKKGDTAAEKDKIKADLQKFSEKSTDRKLSRIEATKN